MCAVPCRSRSTINHGLIAGEESRGDCMDGLFLLFEH